MTETSEKDEVIVKLAKNRRLAHRVLFPHRHKFPDAPFHGEMVDDFHNASIIKLVTEAFRGAAKSTIAEEGFAIRAGFREFNNGLFVGASEDRAMERLESVKHEIEHNEDFAEVFGDLKGSTWTGHKIVTRDDVCLQARGVGQSLRGLKHHQYRPDFVVIDDLEDKESVRSPTARADRLKWLFGTLIPACEPNAVIRFLGNRLDAEAVIVKVANDPKWAARKYPIRYKDKDGNWAASWPGKFPLAFIQESRDEYGRLGLIETWEQEYMCEAEAEEEKVFRADMIRIVPRVRTWEPAWMMFDPSRSIGSRSADTGYACWSYVGHKIVVWDGWSKSLLPNQIIDEMFKADGEFRPVALGVEEDGLNEFLMQPLRQEQVKRGHPLPIRPMRAPREMRKTDFMKGTQPFFNAGEVEFAKPLPELRQQILSFPRGKIDGFNALAYFTRLRPGSPIYEEFGRQNVAEEIYHSLDKTYWLAMNATSSYVTAVLLQYGDGLKIIADYVREGEPLQVASSILTDATLEAGRKVKPVAPPQHFEKYSNVGLVQAIARAPAELRTGTTPLQGREEIRKLFQRQTRGIPSLQVSPQARWTLNAFSGGYARDLKKDAQLGEHAAEGAYKTLMEGLESFAGLLKTGTDEAEEDEGNFRTTDDGRRYRSAMVQR